MARWGSDDDRCIANTPFIQPEPDSDHDDTADRVVTEERDRVRSMIQAWVTHHHSRVQYDTDCDDEYDMHGTTVVTAAIRMRAGETGHALRRGHDESSVVIHRRCHLKMGLASSLPSAPL